MRNQHAHTVVLGVALAVSGCSSKPPPPFEVVVKVQGDPGQPLPGATVLSQNKAVGNTDAQGQTTLRLHGAEGESYALMIACPNGYKSPDKPLNITVRRIADPKKHAEYLVDCPPVTRSVVVAVRAENGPDLPVLYLGEQVAKTDASGAAHVLLKLPPNQTFKLTLDTSADDKKLLRPQNPTATFDVKDRDEIFVFDQTFKRERSYHHYRPHRAGPTPL